MQKIWLIIIGFIMLALIFKCNQIPDQENTLGAKERKSAKLEILYFHPKMRCPTCNAVESNTLKVLKESYQHQIEDGTIKFVSYNMEDESNAALLEKYEISFSSLILLRKDSINEVKTDFTSKAFLNALIKPDNYAKILKEEIDKNLKQKD